MDPRSALIRMSDTMRPASAADVQIQVPQPLLR
jgi:hypothetical protein